jgi:plastocyanin
MWIYLKRDSIFIICILFILLSTSVSASFPYHVFNDKVFNLFEMPTFSLTNPFEKISSNYFILNQQTIVENNPTPSLIIPEPKKQDSIEIITETKDTSHVLKDEIIKQNTPNQHQVLFTMKGFEPSTLTISPGDEVIWTNSRSRTKAMLQGSRKYTGIKSKMLEPNETYSYTFTTPDNYVFIDAIMFSYVFRLTVE